MNSPTYKLPLPLRWLQAIDFPHKLGICDRLFGATIAKQGICWVQTGAGLQWQLDLHNPTHRWIVYGKYEGSAFIDWAKTFLKPDAVIVDSGANIGQMLMYLAQYIPQGKVLAFEPGHHASQWLEICLQQYPNLPVELIRKGLGASPAHLKLNNIGGSVGHGAWNQISETEGEAIEIVRLADQLAERAIAKVDLWKLDVEGYEIPALQGAEELLKQKAINTIYAELTGENGQNIRDYLQQFGYQCYLLEDRRMYIPKDLPSHTNGLFL